MHSKLTWDRKTHFPPVLPTLWVSASQLFDMCVLSLLVGLHLQEGFQFLWSESSPSEFYLSFPHRTLRSSFLAVGAQ